jgi:hypothetical protein
MWMSLRSVLFFGALELPMSEAMGLQTHIFDDGGGSNCCIPTREGRSQNGI